MVVPLARVAADINETWYVLWNVPAPIDAQESDLSVKRQVSTVGMDLCTSTDSGVDYYNSNDVDSYAKLYKWTGDSHYLDVARLLYQATQGAVGICAAGHKAMHHDAWGGYPDEKFLAKLDPKLALLRRRLKAREATRRIPII